MKKSGGGDTDILVQIIESLVIKFCFLPCTLDPSEIPASFEACKDQSCGDVPMLKEMARGPDGDPIEEEAVISDGVCPT